MKRLILISILFSCIQCTKNVPPPGLPEITDQGKNTFGFKLDGNTWIPYFDCGFFTGPTSALMMIVYSDTSGNYRWPIGFDLRAQRESNDYFEMRTNFTGSPATYISHTGNIFDSLNITYQKGDCCDIYSSIPFHSTGFVNIAKLDTANKIISGTFSFKLYTYIGQILDSVVITDGRFDLKFNASICY